ncbi:hypothetical protein HKX54_08120 [Sulfitobacter sp. M57]|uniref:YcaO-like family protein n=1 Tax=unclassified Sulfitobacter TaxID=196795 RepID=UPI0023E1A9F7|nr:MULTISPECIES: YcaO-like family protein [unclassified Sulfitobacter]MDF3414417.1 hypothetical protein [Sulfitobacter sp. KE5]MDF3421898.1 hypothetical protein [Sulfitobacter sp. KE43]MDF3432963.1 hypothetical protein [Sulfitobacter sp. KE42]MDF3458603.1 hypothetical protein [Sulfitobacter sp. S74]MDF3462503.1 hypothetical protein [Sulfitobacter sp. Ks18]
MHVITSDINLNDIWTAPIWPESIYAPALAILQSRTHNGQTASGAGGSREVAFEKCLSETAEILALADQKTDYVSVTDGLAAHPDAKIARHHAQLEALQRKFILDWWAGACPAEYLSDDWLDAAQVTAFVDRARAGATVYRKTQLWHLACTLPVHCMIACSTNRMGQDIILGFGTATDAASAAHLAVTEVMLMELNLYSVMAARGGYRHPDTARIEAIIDEYAKRHGALLSDRSANEASLASGTTHDLSIAMPAHRLIDLTPHPKSRPVWLCQLDDKRIVDVLRPDHPFMAQ